MTRMASAASIKKPASSRMFQDIPAVGTQTRAVYDYFMAYRGVPVPFAASNADHDIMNRLRDRYGLDIRRVKTKTWVLAGEWRGAEYVDFIAPIVTNQELP